MNLEEIREIVKEKLSEKRYNHSICVMKRCAEIAAMYEIDIETMQKIGIAHDVAKEMEPQEKLKYVRDNNIEIDEIEKENTTLLHAKIGADIAIKYFGFNNEMGQAIAAHTTGIPDMNIFSKILFVADRTSEDRDFEDIDKLNRILDINLDEAVLYVLDNKIEIQLKKRKTMHVNTIITRNEILKQLENK